MKTTIFATSDLHISGETTHGKRPIFQMGALATCDRLMCWIGSLIAQTKDPIVHLVLAGDFADFLVERELIMFARNVSSPFLGLKKIYCVSAGPIKITYP